MQQLERRHAHGAVEHRMSVLAVDDRRHVELLRRIAGVALAAARRDVVDLRRRRRVVVVVVVAVDAAGAEVVLGRRRAARDVGVVELRVGEVVAVPAAAVDVRVDLDDAEA